jgi:hypothetical protein
MTQNETAVVAAEDGIGNPRPCTVPDSKRKLLAKKVIVIDPFHVGKQSAVGLNPLDWIVVNDPEATDRQAPESQLLEKQGDSVTECSSQ